MLYSVALLPPESLAAPLSDIRARLDPAHAYKTMPHITLKQPFRLIVGGRSGERALIARLTEVCRGRPALEVELAGVGVFSSALYGSVVHLTVALSLALHTLQAALVLALRELVVGGSEQSCEREQRSFYPHLTLAQGLSEPQAHAGLATLGSVAASRFVARELVLGACGDDGVWRIPSVLALARERELPPQA